MALTRLTEDFISLTATKLADDETGVSVGLATEYGHLHSALQQVDRMPCLVATRIARAEICALFLARFVRPASFAK
jgi:hypothetical protein